LGRSAKLSPGQPVPNDRGGFYIHGRGPRGSDGCNVLMEPAKFQQLMGGLTVSHGEVLMAIETIDGSRFA